VACFHEEQHKKGGAMSRLGGFSKLTVKELAEAADHTCARCYDKTSYFDPEQRRRIGFGRGAHIAGASEGGPRSRPDYTPAQLKAFANGVHLCADCADLVDKDEARYPESDLHSLQRNAEARAREPVVRLGQAGATLTYDQAGRLSQFIQKANDSLRQLDLRNGYDGWRGYWEWQEVQRARSFCADCSWITRLNHPLSAGQSEATHLQASVVSAISAILLQVTKQPWYYSENSPAAYRLSGGDGGEVTWTYLQNVFQLLQTLNGFLDSGRTRILK
jgi:hypothetical protein